MRSSCVTNMIWPAAPDDSCFHLRVRKENISHFTVTYSSIFTLMKQMEKWRDQISHIPAPFHKTYFPKKCQKHKRSYLGNKKCSVYG